MYQTPPAADQAQLSELAGNFSTSIKLVVYSDDGTEKEYVYMMNTTLISEEK